MDYATLHQKYQELSLSGRYLTLNHVEPLLSRYQTAVVGQSVLGKPIYQLLLGSGKTKIFMWSQMHGNESTTTKALFDFINFLHSDTPESITILKAFTFCLLPMVNPDGATAYTRENANGVDLNRDAQNLTQPESVVLRQVFETFQPHYAYNLHDQRTIFGAGESGNPATVSFLAPAFNENRDMNETRIKAIDVIVAMNASLQQLIPNQVGRFDDGFNLNCIGDRLTNLGVPTILFEAGHYPNDYYREYTRKMIFIALISGLKHIYENDIVDNKNELYLQIPQNNAVFYDFIYKNIKINYDGKEIITNFAAQYREELINGNIEFNAYICEVGALEGKIGHFSYNAHKMRYSDGKNDIPNIDEKADFYLEKEPDAVVITEEDLIRDGFSEHPLFYCFVAEEANELLGIALYYYRYSTWKGKTIHLEDLIVKEDQRGKGIGFELYKAIIQKGKEEGVRRIEWAVLDWNTPAIAFYEKTGAKVFSDWRVAKSDSEICSPPPRHSVTSSPVNSM